MASIEEAYRLAGVVHGKDCQVCNLSKGDTK